MLKRAALLVAVLVGAAACDRKAPAPHARVACVGCHRAGDGEGRAGVPNEACSTRRCHPDGGPDSVLLRMVTFAHARHPGANGDTVPCAACHTHETGSTSLEAGGTACALCHFKDIAAPSDSGCVACHGHPSHTRRTSQGLSLPHAALESAHVSCTRCHYRLIEGDTVAPGSRCVACHRQPAAAPRLPGDSTRPSRTALDTTIAGDSAHRTHQDLACTACHARAAHRVVAMSSSIELRCLSCHALLHRPALPAADSAPDSTCARCHPNVHQDEQRLVLGLLPGDAARPSAMFMGGVTCQSCHVASDGRKPEPGRALRGTSASCTGCHGGAWAGVLQRWERGWQRREVLVRAYLRDARAALGDSATPSRPALARLREAEGLLGFTDRAGPLHNLPLADRLMRRSVSLAADAYRVAARPVPPVPELGPPVETGTCIACHYGIEEVRIRASSDSGRATTHAEHLFGGRLTCDACHAVGAAPPGLSGARWPDSVRR